MKASYNNEQNPSDAYIASWWSYQQQAQGYSSRTGGVSNDSSISIARVETKAVNRSKIIVLAVIVIATSACGVATYIFTKSEEEDAFRSQVKRDE
jgi:hypothetical protein